MEKDSYMPQSGWFKINNLLFSTWPQAFNYLRRYVYFSDEESAEYLYLLTVDAGHGGFFKHLLTKF